VGLTPQRRATVSFDSANSCGDSGPLECGSALLCRFGFFSFGFSRRAWNGGRAKRNNQAAGRSGRGQFARFGSAERSRQRGRVEGGSPACGASPAHVFSLWRVTPAPQPSFHTPVATAKSTHLLIAQQRGREAPVTPSAPGFPDATSCPIFLCDLVESTVAALWAKWSLAADGWLRVASPCP
jgi:hypothetical protein